MKKTLLLILLLFSFFKLEATEGSVVCIHGFCRSYKCMIPMGNTLRNAGFSVYLWDYQSRKGTIEQHAEDLVEVLNAIAKKEPGKPIHFVTHSLGGIVVRAATNHPDCPEEAKMGKAVLLAPPNKGAALARQFRECPPIRWVFGKKAGFQLLTFEELDMQCFGRFPETMKVMVIAGTKTPTFFQIWVKEPSDGKVTVQETYLDTPHIHQILYVSHSWIMTSRESIGITKDFLLSEEEVFCPEMPLPLYETYITP